jgi:hypothetical protein
MGEDIKFVKKFVYIKKSLYLCTEIDKNKKTKIKRINYE